MNSKSLVATLLAMTALSGSACRWDEGIMIENLRGKVVIPVEAATRDIERLDGSIDTIGPDVRLIGPIYLGLYSEVMPAGTIERYPHPATGPQNIAGVAGNALPYGGTTLGDLRYPCVEALSCKMTSGRFVDYDDIVDWFNNVLEQPIADPFGEPITNGEYLKQMCYQILDVTTDEEVRLIASDKNGDGEVDQADLDFTLNADGDFIADFTIYQQEHFFKQTEECEGGVDCDAYKLWGFMDGPSERILEYSTCSTNLGFYSGDYANGFRGGASNPDVLNVPSKYLDNGDWVASESYEWKNIYEQPVLRIDFEVK